MLSVLDIFKVGIGPSSSHTMGPMRIASRFLKEASASDVLHAARQVRVDLHGSLALTGIGHGTDRAVMLGLMGFEPESIEPLEADHAIQRLKQTQTIEIDDHPSGLRFDPRKDLELRGDIIPELHPNEMELTLLDETDRSVFTQTYYSVGGGFIATALQLNSPSDGDLIQRTRSEKHPFSSASELLEVCAAQECSIAQVVLANEDSFRPRPETLDQLDQIWAVMRACIHLGLETEGVLPGGLEVQRRAPALFTKLNDTPFGNERERLFDWLNVYAMAVNEENAAGGRVVTAPTNGAAGIVPAVLRYYCDEDGVARMDDIRLFLLTAAAIGILFKQRASISGAEMGCQGEVGVACSMAAAGLTAVWGGTPSQVEHAAEIGIEHNLGLTCDPVGGLVQIPCIERNAIGAVKAVNAARLALRAAEQYKVSLDQAIETMRQTGLDMSTKYKETSEGGLAVNVIEC